MIVAAAVDRPALARSFAAFITGPRVRPPFAGRFLATLPTAAAAEVWTALVDARLQEPNAEYLELCARSRVRELEHPLATEWRQLLSDIEERRMIVADLRSALKSSTGREALP